MDASPTASRLVVGAAIVDDLAHPAWVLSARRTYPPELAGRWELPGGKVEPGEEPQDALHREIREELGIDVELGALVPGPAPASVQGRVTATWPLGERSVMAVWLAVVTEGEPRILADHDELRVLTKAELYSVSWLPADLPIMAALAALMV